MSKLTEERINILKTSLKNLEDIRLELWSLKQRIETSLSDLDEIIEDIKDECNWKKE